MTSMNLDKTKPYGVIYGGGKAKYEQNNKLFDAQGNEIKPVAVEPATQETAEQPTEREALKAEVIALGGTFASNIPTPKLEAMRDKLKADQVAPE